MCDKELPYRTFLDLLGCFSPIDAKGFFVAFYEANNLICDNPLGVFVFCFRPFPDGQGIKPANVTEVYVVWSYFFVLFGTISSILAAATFANLFDKERLLLKWFCLFWWAIGLAFFTGDWVLYLAPQCPRLSSLQRNHPNLIDVIVEVGCVLEESYYFFKTIFLINCLNDLIQYNYSFF